VGELEGWRHCPRCAAPLAHEARSARCAACGLVVYEKPSPAVCALVLDGDGRVLLGRRAQEPGEGRWDILGGFVEEDEDPLDALRRELREETGLDVEPIEWVGAVADRYGDDGGATLNLCWTARVVGGELRRDAELAELRWFGRSELPRGEELAFPNCERLLDLWRAGPDGLPRSGVA
jgi:ADP-ribose pyrophosphatase YjhB (NUDIX family)